MNKRPSRAAFTLVELLVVVAVLALVALLQMGAASDTREVGRGTVCQNNLRRMMLAWQMYASENDGRLVGNLDGGGVQPLSNSNRTWVLGWLDVSGGSPPGANTNTELLTVYSPLAPYMGRVAGVFKCPADKSLSLGTRGQPRVRSISMNGYMGERNGPYTTGYRLFKRMSEIVSPSPVRAFVFIDEREDSINDGCLQIDMTGFDPLNPMMYQIVDVPAEWHNRGVNLSFADGHAETWHWRDPRTMPAHHRGNLLPLGISSPNNPDVARLQAATSSRAQ
jgi:prepilin-type N-terminal cleavage/methylation domain-containing protein/prepilin-type processing-associated H-X9-DG protein